MNESKTGQTRAKESLIEGEISLIDVAIFLIRSWKIILISAIFGLIGSGALLILTPSQYEAVAQIAMAQISGPNNIIGVNIEEPALLISRLSSPTSYTQEVLSVCNVSSGQETAKILAKNIKLSIPKGVTNIVELKTYGNSPAAASDCARSIYELIKSTQAQIVKPLIDEVKIKLADDTERLLNAKAFVFKSDKSGQAMSSRYLATRDEIRYLLDDISSLQNILSTYSNRSTHLIAPIYAGDFPIAPKKRLILSVGLMVGLIFGVVLALGMQILDKLKLMWSKSSDLV